MFQGFPRKHSGKPSPAPFDLYRLYFKGMVSEDSLAGLGIAICGKNDDVLFQMKTPIFGSDVTVLEAELRALKLGLTEAVDLGITHISIYCDDQPIYRLITGGSVLEENKFGMLLNEVQHIRGKFASSFPVLVAPDNIRYAYQLAREITVSETRIQVDTETITCSICFDEDISAGQMFSVDTCCHQFCSECMRRHIEVKLLEQCFLSCPHYRCKSELTFQRCAYLLTPKLKAVWEQRIKEDSIPVSERIYCPNPRCSALLSKSTKEVGVRRWCVKCIKPFCINCKVAWHSNLLCDHYKRLHPNPTENDGKLKDLADEKMWRQCGKCQHMIELSGGCIAVKCRCGHEFCYRCGAEAGGCPHGHGIDLDLGPLPTCCRILLFVIILGIAIWCLV